MMISFADKREIHGSQFRTETITEDGTENAELTTKGSL